MASCPTPPPSIGAADMSDLLFVSVPLAFFALAAVVLKGVERL